ncbi:MAG: shikimate kinase [Lachnospiraceae bacterium]|nr:shikimate kinase [Lachnospiraceae bacterium]
MQTKNNIVLIGMPASGKSTVGVILAKILGMDFIDTDILIQQKEGARLSRIIEMNGIDDFLKREERALLDLNVSGTVIATGGSAVYSDTAMKHLAEGSVVIYLKAKLDEIKKRLGDIKERGVVLKDGESIEEMYNVRSGLYEKYADITVDEDGRTIDDTIRKILDGFRKI